MPESQAAFDVAKEALIARMRTERTTGEDVIYAYLENRDMGLTESREKNIYETVQNLTLEDVKATQQKWVKDRTYVYGILGDIKDLDTKYLRTLGPVQILSLEDIFGY
jgi:predicted Zn-dependent peptidase